MALFSITFSFDRRSDEDARALLALAEILDGEDDDLSQSCIEILPFVFDNIFDRWEEIEDRLIEAQDGEPYIIENLARAFKIASESLETKLAKAE